MVRIRSPARVGKSVTLENEQIVPPHILAGRPIPKLIEMKASVAYADPLARRAQGGKAYRRKGNGCRRAEESRQPCAREGGLKEQCAVCHGDDGLGKRVRAAGDSKGHEFPPLCGPDATSSRPPCSVSCRPSNIFTSTCLSAKQLGIAQPLRKMSPSARVFVTSHPRLSALGPAYSRAKDFSQSVRQASGFSVRSLCDSFQQDDLRRQVTALIIVYIKRVLR